VGNNLLDKINQYFQTDDYDQIPTDSEKVAMYGCYVDSNLYLVNVIDLEDGYALDEEGYLEYKQMTMQQLRHEDADKIILLNLILTNKTEDLCIFFNHTPDQTVHLVDVVWLLDKQKRRLVIPKKQIKKVLGIQKVLKKILGEDRQ